MLEDLRDAYPGALEETILTEIVANSLDSGAGSIVLAPDPERATITVIDDGRGMVRRELTRYHDLAASSKTRGHGIGFAGVGIKLGLLLAEEVITETKRGKVHVATSWRLASRTRAPWKLIEPHGLVATHGTAVTLKLDNPLSPLLDSGFVASTITTHFQPLFESIFDEMLADAYKAGVVFVVGRRMLQRDVATVQDAPLTIHTGRKRKPSGVGYLARSVEPLPESQRGIAISTLGKVIKRGWDWLGITPVDAEHMHGLVEVPALAEALTLNKADFVRTGTRGALYLTYRKAIQEAVSAQLAIWGDESSEVKRQPRTRPIERDIERVLGTMTHNFPLLSTLVERRGPGQRRLLFGTATDPDHTAPVTMYSRPARFSGATKSDSRSSCDGTEKDLAHTFLYFRLGKVRMSHSDTGSTQLPRRVPQTLSDRKLFSRRQSFHWFAGLVFWCLHVGIIAVGLISVRPPLGGG